MKLPEAIECTAPLRDVRLVSRDPAREAEQRQRAAEQAAYESGRRDGEKALGEQLLQQRAEMLELHRGVVESLRAAVPQLIHDTEQALIGLALEAAQKIVAGMPVTSKMVEAVVRDAVRQVEDSADVTVQLHPEDLALLRKHKSPILNGLPETGSLRFTASSEVTRGGCVVLSSFGLLDERRETKIEQMRQTLSA
jgi:flagellar assembly protein FliH